ncbi:methyltransferase [Pseudonocardia benzenivorans]|nr:hydroxyneurosporene-O-methyltransferase [Pseudonocardia sp. D17]
MSETVSDSRADAARLLEIVNSAWMPQALRAAAELGVPDLLADGPRTAADVAEATGAHAASLHRLLRALVTIDVLTEDGEGGFALTPMGGLLRADVDGTVRSWAIYQGRDVWDEWGLMPEAVRTGRSGREIAHGAGGFAPLRDDPRRAATFNSAMAELTRLSARAVVAGHDFGRYRRVADIGGGYGELLGTILRAHPGSTGILFDLPHAVDAAAGHLDGMGVRDRCEIVSGSFFEEVPTGADLYVLKSVLHDWDDDRAAEILAVVRRAIGPGARLLLVERLMPDRMRAVPEHRLLARADMNMLVAHAAPERTEGQWRALLGSAGFDVVAVTPIPGAATAIEAVPAVGGVTGHGR